VGCPCADWLWGQSPEYNSQLYEEHDWLWGQSPEWQRCEVYADIPSHPVFPDGSPWSTWPIGADMDDATDIVFQVHYHSGWTYMVEYAQHLFQLKHDTQRIVVEQWCRLVGYAKEVKNLT
jgi:hypothetical protein